ncbi:hypothetical protein SKAU_G00195780, partial [Synaphobranchus kaupii]
MFTVLKAWQKNHGALLCVLITLGTLAYCRVVPGTRKATATNDFKSNIQKRVHDLRSDSETPVNYGTLLIGKAQLNGNFRVGQTREGLERNEMKYQTKSLDYEFDYQSDSALNEHAQWTPRALSGSSAKASPPPIQNLLHLSPLVECGTDTMMLIIRGGIPHHPLHFMVDRGGSATPLPLKQVPPQCGYTLTTSQNMIFTAPYLGCYGIQDGGSYVLPLLWSGTPVKMSCPIIPTLHPSPSVSCYPFGMVVNIPQRLASSKDIRVKVKDEWQPSSMVAHCDYNVMSHPGGLVITAPYGPCGAVKDGSHTLNILSREGELQLSCPFVWASTVAPLRHSVELPHSHTGKVPVRPQRPAPEPHPQYPAPHPQRPAPEPLPHYPAAQRPAPEPLPQRPSPEPLPQYPAPAPQRPVPEPRPQRPSPEPLPQYPAPAPQRPVPEPRPQYPAPQRPAPEPLPQHPEPFPQRPAPEPHPQYPAPHPQRPAPEPLPQYP